MLRVNMQLSCIFADGVYHSTSLNLSTWVSYGCTGWDSRSLRVLECLHRENDPWCCHQTDDYRSPSNHIVTLGEELLINEGLQQGALAGTLFKKSNTIVSR